MSLSVKQRIIAHGLDCLAKHRGIRLGKFHDHLKETEWRWNHRREILYKLLLNETRRRPLS